MREADRWLEFARQDLRIAELAMNEAYTTRSVFTLNNALKKF